MALTLSFAEKTPLNLVMNIIKVGVMAIIGILMVPYYIDQLGMAAYGIIPLATTISGYLMIMTDSIGAACNRYSTVAIHDKGDANKELSTAFFGISRICLVLLPIVIIFSMCTPWIFGIGTSLSADDVRIMFALILVGALIYTLATAFFPVFNATNNNYRYELVRTIYLLLQVGMILSLFYFKGASVAYIGLAYFVSAVIALLLMYIAARKTYPPMRLKSEYYDKELFHTIGHLAFWNIVDRVGSVLFFQASLIVVNIMIGTYYGGEFAIIATSVSMLNTVCMALITVVNPHLYRAFSEDKESIIGLIAAALKFIAYLIVVPVAFIIVFSQELLTIWVGPEYSHLASILSIALGCNIVFATSTMLEEVPVIFLKMRQMATITVIFGIINIVACVIVLALDFGLEGVVWTTGATVLAFGTVRICYAETITGAQRFRYLRYVAYSAIAIVVVGLIFLGIRNLDIVGCFLTRLFFLFLASFIVFELVALKFLFNGEEKNKIEQTLPGKLKTFFVRVFE